MCRGGCGPTVLKQDVASRCRSRGDRGRGPGLSRPTPGDLDRLGRHSPPTPTLAGSLAVTATRDHVRRYSAIDCETVRQCCAGISACRGSSCVASDISRSLLVLSGICPRWRRSEQESSSRANGRTRLRHRSGKLALSCVTDRCEPRRREVFSRALVGDTGTDGPTPRVTTSGSKRRPNSRGSPATSPQPPSIISPCPRPGVYRGRGGPVGTTETARDAPRRDALSSYNRGVKSVSVPQRSDRQTGRRQDRPPSQHRHSRSRRRGASAQADRPPLHGFAPRSPIRCYRVVGLY